MVSALAMMKLFVNAVVMIGVLKSTIKGRSSGSDAIAITEDSNHSNCCTVQREGVWRVHAGCVWKAKWGTRSHYVLDFQSTEHRDYIATCNDTKSDSTILIRSPLA
ncbi:hypothetical protein Ancab_006875 [Ancistrocladus abbreviatus]